MIQKKWCERSDINAISVWLASFGVTPGQIKKIAKKFGNRAKDIIENQPYCLCENIDGIGFLINDQIALINDMFGTPSKSTAGTSSSAPSFPAISTDFYSGQQNIVNPLAGTYYGETGRDPMPTNVTINVDATSMVDPANMTRVVQQAFLEINRNGYSTVPAGQGF